MHLAERRHYAVDIIISREALVSKAGVDAMKTIDTRS